MLSESTITPKPRDFLTVPELAALLGIPAKSIYNQHSSKTGDLGPILTKFCGRVGCWAADYAKLVASRRKFHDAA